MKTSCLLASMLVSAFVCVEARDPEAIVDSSRIVPQGTYYEATVPDTLDLAEMARIAINGNIGNIDPDKFHAVRFMFTWATNPPSFPIDHTWNLAPKNLRALPWLRTMTGDDFGVDIERDTMIAYLNQVGDDGLVYYPYGGEGVPEGSSYPITNGLVGLVAQNWYERDGNEAWKPWLALIGDGLRKMAIEVEDRAYFPPESGMNRDGEWLWTTRGGPLAQFPYSPPEEPELEQQGYEQCVKYEQAYAIRALLQDYAVNGDEESLETVRQLVRFCLKPGMWEDRDDDTFPANEHGQWAGHSHGTLQAMMALFDAGALTNDLQLMGIVQKAYEHYRRLSITRLGWAPFWHLTEKYGRVEWWRGVCDGCQPGDAAIVAMKLTDAGLADYWDDIEHIARNQMAEQIIDDLDKMREVSGVEAGSEGDALLKKFVGGSTGVSLTAAQPGPIFYGCCTPNNAIGMYYIWHGITRFERGVATVNLFLNRASAWMDIDSYLPYEGRVVLRNKQAHTALVRVPGWLTGRTIACALNGKPVEVPKVGNRLLFQGLKPDDIIELTFDVPDSTERYTVNDVVYTIEFRGSTAVNIEPKDTEQIKGWDNPQWWALHTIYERDEMKADTAPMRDVTRFVADKILPLQ